MKVSDILQKLPVIKSDIIKDEEVNGAFLDSRLVRPGSLFFACRGENADGNLYVQKSLDAGAATVIKALGAGKKAGIAMNKWIEENRDKCTIDKEAEGKLYVPDL